MKTLHHVLDELNEAIESGIEFPEAVWRMTMRHDLKPNEVQRLKDLYDAQSDTGYDESQNDTWPAQDWERE